MLNGIQQPQPQTNPKHMLMAVVGMSALFAGAIMMVAAVTTGEPPFPEGPPPPAPAKVHMLPEEWLPKIKEAAQTHRSDASYLYTANYHPDDWENLDGHLKHNIGPALGWHFTKVGAKTRVVLPKEDLPLLDRLAESPRAFVAENAWTNPQDDQTQRTRERRDPMGAHPGRTHRAAPVDRNSGNGNSQRGNHAGINRDPEG